MQSLIGDCRSHLPSEAYIRSVVEGAPVEVRFGVDMLTQRDCLESTIDISSCVEADGSSLERNNFRTIHGTCKLVINQRLPWTTVRVRPYVQLHCHHKMFRVNMGVYLLSTPTTTREGRFEVEGYDKIWYLDRPIGATWRAPGGETALAEAVRAVEAAEGVGPGEAQIRVVGLGSDLDAALEEDRLWPIGDETTYLRVVNDLLESIGYRGVWCDWQGSYRLEPYQLPWDRAIEWCYDTNNPNTTVAQERSFTEDVFSTPNRWVFLPDDPPSGDPVPANEMWKLDPYEVVNLADGPASVQARNLVVTASPCPQLVPASSREILESTGNRIATENLRPHRYYEILAGPNPLHWHFDIIGVSDAELGLGIDGAEKMQVSSWRFDAAGGDMTINARAVRGLGEEPTTA